MIVLCRRGGKLDWLSLMRGSYEKRSGYKIGLMGGFTYKGKRVDGSILLR
jgi:hypothetical protein